MTTSVFKIERPSAASVGRSSVAPGPSSSTYFAEGSNSTGEAHLVRINSDGTINWQKKITISGASSAQGITPSIASSSDHLAVVLRYSTDSGATYTSTVVLYDSSGTIIWQKVVPVSIVRPAAINVSFITAGSTAVVVAEDESVYLTGTTNSDAKTNLLKLAGSDGSLTWAVNLSPTTAGSGTDGHTALALLSGGDPVVAFYGGDPTSDGEYSHFQRITASTGAAAWTRRVLWNNGSELGTAIAVDPSDNVYIATAYGSSNSFNIGKVDSSGTTLWMRSISLTGGTTSQIALRLAADATGVYIPYNTTTTTFGHIFVPAAGTVGFNNVKRSIYTALTNPLSYESFGGGISGSQMLMSLTDRITSGNPYYGVVIRTESASTDDSTFGTTYTRTTTTYDLNSGNSGTLSSPSYTRAANPSITLSAGSITEASVSLTVTALAPSLIATATGLASTAAFGLPEMQGVQRPYTISTVLGAPTHARGLYATGTAATAAFGTPAPRISYSATGLLNTNLFGLPVYSDDKVVTATGIGSTAAVGTPFSVRGIVPAPVGLASSLDPATTFGTAVAGSVLYATATGFSPTAFGTTTHAQGLSATALAPATAFGTPNGPVLARAQGFSTTTFGATRVACLGYAAALSSATRFGAPALSNIYSCAATGWSATAFGTPLTRWPTRTRSGVFRTQFGRTQAERTPP